MKKLVLVFLIGISASSFYAQEVENIQKSLVVKKTATWCPKCGDWGWDLFINIIDDLKEEPVVFLAAHYSGALQNLAGQAISDNFGVAGQPNFYFNGTDQDVIKSNIDTKRDEIKQLVADHKGGTAIASAGSSTSMDGDNLIIDTNVKFFQDVEGDFYVSHYIVEDNLKFFQAGFPEPNDAIHKKILRWHLTEDNLADQIKDGSINANESFQNTYTIPINTDWNLDSLSVQSIIWKKEGEKLLFLNAAEQLVDLTSPIAEIENEIEGFEAYYTSDHNILTKFVSKSDHPAQVNLHDISGKLIFSTSLNIRQGANEYKIGTEHKSSGLQIFTIRINGYTPLSRKLNSFR